MSEEVDKSVEMSDTEGNAEFSAVVQPTAKKRNRRKERPKKNKSTQPSTSIVAVAAEMEKLDINSLPIADGGAVPLKPISNPISIAITLDPGMGNSEKPIISTKKSRKKKMNVALASIEKISEANGKVTEIPAPAYATGGSTGEQRASPVKLGSPSKSGRKDKGKSAPSLQSGENSKRIVKSPEKKLKQNMQESKPQQSSRHLHSLQRSGGLRNPISKRNEPMLNENQFDDVIQREQVEVMLKEGSYPLVKGFIRINQRNYREAYISNPDGSRDILIDGVKARNRALEGDEVVVLILPESTWKIFEGVTQKVGKVVHILAKIHQRQAVGNLKKMADGNSRLALFSPRDSRVPRMRIPMKECLKTSQDWDNNLFYARIVEWNDVRFAKGQLIGDSFGVQGDIEAETRAILLDNEIDFSPYTPNLYAYFPKPPFILSDQDLHGREDLRKLCIFTIDPRTAKDLDDAVSCQKLENGNYRVGVHISDVSYFLREGTPLDKEVAKRATTTYVVQRAYHMLPREMTMMCSLLPGEDKLAFSVFWEITPEAEVISHYFTRSTIHSCTQLAYEHAQLMIDEPNREWQDGDLPKIHAGWTVEDLKEVVTSLQSLAVIMRKRRFDGGALRVDQTKLMFNLDGAGEPVDFSAYVNKESHRLIEEFMLLANMTVATDIQKKFPSLAFLRCHDEPQPDMLKKLAEVLEKFGIVLETSSAGALHESMQRYQCNSDVARFVALNSLCSRPMVRARYFCAANIGDVNCMRHYALNAPLYTHFTSPIRRYADVMVHRLLATLLGYNEELKWTVDYVNQIAANCNKMKFCAKKAGEQSTELFLALWVRKHGSIQVEAVVIDVKDRSFDAIVCSTGSNIRVYTDKLAAAVEFESSSVPQLQIKWSVAAGRTQQAHQVITMFSVVQVVLHTSNTNLLKLEANLVPPSE